jgi:hypothetical protein
MDGNQVLFYLFEKPLVQRNDRDIECVFVEVLGKPRLIDKGVLACIRTLGERSPHTIGNADPFSIAP